MPLFTPIYAPTLSSIDQVNVSNFVKEIEHSELEIESKQAYITKTLKPLPYTTSIDRKILCSMVFIGKFEEVVKDITDVTKIANEHVKKYIKNITKRVGKKKIDPEAIKKAVGNLTMPRRITDAEAHVTSFCADFVYWLKSIMRADFPTINLMKSVRLLLVRVQPPALNNYMRRRIGYHQSL